MSKKVTTSISMDASMWRWIEKIATKESRSVSGQVRYWLTAIKNKEK